MVSHGAWDQGWFIGSTFLSSGHLSPLHPWYGGLGVKTVGTKKKLSKIKKLACLGITGVMRTTPTMAVKALICLPSFDLTVQSEARSAALCLWSLGC